ncbi:hypothetical protein [Paenibacillus sp. Cedars]|uniref:hypothetical protein n=1 Tax=Paenibacillus sp. Cedars TaxID=1980674 RepID=UPI001165B12F|nr:hypothetical protein [Paenibacillus sp. Cedars]AWP30504.1 hypothetical protein B9D94_29580 [Paenibacillus sp. Cedars]
MKKLRKQQKLVITCAVIILTISWIINYYSVRLPATSLISHFTTIEKIFFYHLNGSNITPYLIEFEDNHNELNQWMSILDSVSYTRSARSFVTKNIRNDGGETFAFTIFYRDGDGELHDYFLDMNQKGYAIRGQNKMYKMVERESEVFEQLSACLFEKAVEMPVNSSK